MRGAGRRRGAATAVAAVLAVLGTLALHGHVLGAFWRFDDPLILMHVLKNADFAGDFVSATQWRALGVPFFTPWLTLEYRLDLALFGLNPLGFQARHLGMLAVLALAGLMLLRPLVGTGAALAATLLFLAGAPVAVVAEQLMSRHYVSGLVCAVLAVLLWRRLDGRQGDGWLGLGVAFAYVLAALNKEVFAPLPLVLWFLPGGPRGWARVRSFAPVALVACGYAAWRWHMLGTGVGGYHDSLGGGALAAFESLLVQAPALFFGEGWQRLVPGLGLCLSLFVVIRQRHQARLVGAVLLTLALPLMAVRLSAPPQDLRYLLFAWGACCVVLGLGLEHGWRAALARSGVLRGAGVAALLGLCGVTLWATLSTTQAARDAMHDSLVAHDVQGQFMWFHGADRALLPQGLLGPGYLTALAALKSAGGHGPAPVSLPFAEAADRLAPGRTVSALDMGCRCMRPADTAAAGASPVALPADRVMVDRQNGFAWSVNVPEAGPEVQCHLFFAGWHSGIMLPACAGRLPYDLPDWAGGDFMALVRAEDGRWAMSHALRFPEAGARLTPGSGQQATDGMDVVD